MRHIKLFESFLREKTEELYKEDYERMAVNHEHMASFFERQGNKVARDHERELARQARQKAQRAKSKNMKNG